MRNSSLFGLAKPLLVAVMVVSISVFMPGCDDDDDSSGGGSGGPSTVSGNVASFTAPTVVYIPKTPSSSLNTFLTGVVDLLVPDALAGVGGVNVSVVGTDISTSTSGGGSFTLSGVPAGKQEFVFSMGAYSGILEYDVPGDSVIEFVDVQVTPDGVSVGDVRIVETRKVTTSTGGSPGGDGGDDGAGEDGDSSDDADSSDDDHS